MNHIEQIILKFIQIYSIPNIQKENTVKIKNY